VIVDCHKMNGKNRFLQKGVNQGGRDRIDVINHHLQLPPSSFLMGRSISIMPIDTSMPFSRTVQALGQVKTSIMTPPVVQRDCSISSYTQTFNRKVNQCMSRHPGLVAFDGGASCVTLGVQETLKEMSHCKEVADHHDCSPQGYLRAVGKKFESKKVTVDDVNSKIEDEVKGTVIAAGVGCAVGTIVGGVAGAVITGAESGGLGAPVGAALGGVLGCKRGAAVGVGTYRVYKGIKKAGGLHEATQKTVYALKEHSQVCTAKPLQE